MNLSLVDAFGKFGAKPRNRVYSRPQWRLTEPWCSTVQEPISDTLLRGYFATRTGSPENQLTPRRARTLANILRLRGMARFPYGWS